MDADNMPIDIHSSKLLDWLVNRRHCDKDWQKKVLTIREKINLAIQDMPEHPEIVRLLQGTYINYFHCTRIVDILRETEADTKNFLGYYSSQRMKDWQQIVSLYQSDNVFLAEAAQLLQRLVQYDIPALKKHIAKCQSGVEEAQRKERDYEKQAVDGRRQYARDCHKMGVQGEQLRLEFFQLAQDLPAFFDQLAKDIGKLAPAIDYYHHFRQYLLKGSITAASQQPPLLLLPALRLVGQKGASVTAFEQLHGRAPLSVEAPSFGIVGGGGDSDKADDAIDFGGNEVADAGIDFDDGGVDFGSDGSEPPQSLDITVVGDDNSGHLDDGVARGDEALSVFENQRTQQQLLSELNELRAFFECRIADDRSETTADLLLAGRGNRPGELVAVGEVHLQQWLNQITSVLSAVNDPQKRHLLRIRASPRYVEGLVESLEQKRALEGKYGRMRELMRERQTELAKDAADAQPKLHLLIGSTKQLQKQVEGEISKKYKGRPVNIMGGISAATSM